MSSDRVGGAASGLLARLMDWQRDTADIIASLGSPAMPEVLDRSLSRLVPFDMTVAFAYPDSRQPMLLHDGLSQQGTRQALENYLNGAYLLDPFYTACAQRVLPGLYRMHELAPDHFFASEYVNAWEVHPCISLESGSLAEEIGFMVALPGGIMGSYSLMRKNGQAKFSAAEMEILRQVEPVVRQAIQLHWRDLQADVPPTALPRAELLESAFQSFGADQLSTREKLIVQMILRGHSTLSIANCLEIAEGTVKNHRKSIYAKLSIGSQQQLFTRFLSHVLA